MTSTLTDHLRALGDDALAALLTRRPDLITPPASDLSALAARAQSRVSVARALEGLDLFTLEVLDAARISRTPEGTTSFDAIAAWTAGTDGRAVRLALARLQDLFIVYGQPTALQIVASVDEICSPYPAGLGRPATELDPAAATLAADAAGLRRALLAASPASRAVLDRLAAGPPLGTTSAPALADPESAVGALVARGLLVATADDTVELPREVAYALRRDGRLGPMHPQPPEIGATQRTAKTVDAAATGQAMEAVRHTEAVLEALDDEPAAALKTGGIGVRDLRRIARAADVPEPTAAVLIEVAAAAGLIGETETSPSSRAVAETRFLVTLAYDQWCAASTAERWARLARAWLVMNRQPGLIGRRTPTASTPTAPRRATAADKDRPISVLGPELERTGAPRLRAAVLGVLADAPPGATPSFDELLAALHWRAPRRSPWQPGADGDSPATGPVRWTLDEAGLLGLIGLGGVAGYARRLLAEVIATAERNPDDDPLGLSDPATALSSRAVATLDALLPAPVDHMLIQADLTVVVPGPPEPTLAAELALVAERESAGGASVYRVTPERIRHALDTGYQAAELHKMFASRSRTGVPQSLSYLIDDTARRHGGLRAGAAGCYLRSDDAALLVEIAADRKMADLSLRLLAPTVLISPFLIGRVLSSLRDAGYAPVQEDAGGAVVVSRPRAFRAPPRRTPPSAPAFTDTAPGLTPARLAAVVEALRAGDVAARKARRAPVTIRAVPDGATAAQAHTQAMAVLQQAIRDKQRVWVGYVDAHGATASRLLRPVSLGAGYLRAEDERTEMLHTLALHRITAVVVDT
jgi:Helicase conserved C-terminal domain